MDNKIVRRLNYSLCKSIEDDDEVFEKIIVPSYIDVFNEFDRVPNILKIAERIRYNVSTRAFDCIYGYGEDFFTNDVVGKFLSNYYFVYESAGAIFNDGRFQCFSELFSDISMMIE